MKYILTIVLLLAFIAGNLFAQKHSIACFPVSVCNIVETYKSDLKKNTEIQLAIKIQGDLHHFSPSVQDIKTLVSADYLILPPKELFPSQTKIIQLREKNPTLKNKTLVLKTPHRFYEIYSKGNYAKKGHSVPETISHFWLYPDIYCDFKNIVGNQIKEWNFLDAKSVQTCESKNYFEKLGLISKKFKNYTFIETHDALGPLLERFGIGHIALKGGGHHNQITSATLKKIKEARKSGRRIIWLVETDIHHSDYWKENSEKEDRVIFLKCLGKMGEKATKVLDQLVEELLSK